MRHARLVPFALLGLVPAAAADGFALRDLTAAAAEARTALGRGFQAKAERERLRLICTGCEGDPIVDLQLGRQSDGTEGRVRSGQTTFDKLEALCRARNPTCRLSGLSVAPAVGWLTSYSLGGTAGATATVIRDGDLLTVRVLAATEAVATAHARRLVETLVPRIVGP
ncbi:hypothetical protein [Methylobacterium oxalidis]|uniref:Uncharacterized protein n=1 Tax=Methylobacterium oxalidis TaxID=944322 RepID=A0A512J0D6_9HYPH|nr:hypothetical protein [Methylobacterium oxalidis]GEP03426.1 hypothetical protein MOX02_14640 [Methylobacterium oxalidis]GLS63369.1 hypothetical protein GCM10007888_17500 [Methylobacterium oxalidis]